MLGETEMEAPRRAKARSVPLELQMLILSWLPVEEILRLLVVCKQWASLLHDPHFRALWAQNSRHRFAHKFILLQYAFVNSTYNSSTVRTRCCEYLTRPLCKEDACLGDLPEVNWFTPKGSQGLLSVGGLMLSYERTGKKRLWVGNPVTKEWVQVPALGHLQMGTCRSQMLVPYMSEGWMFFRIWVDPYLFDSKVGIWMRPRYQTIYMYSSNTLHIQGVQYGLGYCRQHNAIVLAEIDDLGALWEATWLYAWDKFKLGILSHAYMLKMGGGEIGLLAKMNKDQVVVVVLDRKSTGEEWSWRKVSTLPEHLQKRMKVDFDSRTCCTHGHCTFLSGAGGVVVFDSQCLTWEWVEAKGRFVLCPQRPVVLVPDLAAVPNLNRPSEELKKKCTSRDTTDHVIPIQHGNFSELEALSRRGMSWQEIGKSAAVQWRKGTYTLEMILDT